MPGFEGYSNEIQAALKKLHIDPGHKVEVSKGAKKWVGAVMPRVGGDPDALVLKLDNGYNIGIKFGPGVKIAKAKEEKILRKAPEVAVHPSHKASTAPVNPHLPTIAILHTGGTIASRLDYRTGAVMPLVTAEDIVEMYPELRDVANVRARVVFQIFSEDMEPDHWIALAREVYKEIRETGCDGVIITHGTDTMHYTAAALSFMLRELPVPVLLVGSQRSSDRPSSDAGLNLISAARFIAGSDWSGVGICMHATPADDACWVLPATRTKKMHTSRRDTFRPIDAQPIAIIRAALNTIEMIAKNYPKKDAKRVPKLDNVFEPHIALVKLHPGFKADALRWHLENCHGIVLEGTGLGHAPINHADDLTARHPELLEMLAASKKKCVVFMASQCPYGRVNLNVYSTGRDLQKAGVLPANMLAETAFVKLGWVLGHTKDRQRVKEMMAQDVAGEMYSRTEHDAFPDEGMESRDRK
ncbi:MAG: Glu-tRNA(Gln) amidotransferase subunit GatD [Candidatus Aenigmatarchaeota archaeon]